MNSLFRIAIILCFACAAAGSVAQLPPVIDYVGDPDFTLARLSPDGAHIALVTSRSNTEVVHILDTETQQTTATFETQTGFGILQYWWANEERIIVATSYTPPGDKPYMTGDLYAFNVDNTEKFLLAGPSNGDGMVFSVLDTLQNERRRVIVVGKPVRSDSLARSHPIAYTMDIYKPKRTHANTRFNDERLGNRVGSPLGWGELATDNAGAVRLAYAANDAGTLDIKVKRGDEWADVSTFLGVETDGVNLELGQPLGFNSANTGIYHFTHSPHGTVGVALFDIEDGVSTLLFAHEKYDISAGGLVYAADGKDLIGATVVGVQYEKHYFTDHPDTAFHRSLDKGLQGNRIDFLNFSDDQRKGLALVGSSVAPPALFLLDRDKGEFTPLFSAMAKLQGTPMTAVEPIGVTARDGVPLEGYLTPAVGVEGPAPLVVLVHGGPHGVRDEPGFNPEVKLLASRGYSVLQVNYRGSGGYGLGFRERGYRNWGGAMIDDIVDATRHVIAQGKVDPARMCVMGASYGGYAAMMALARYPDMWRCGVGISGVYDLTYMAKSDIGFIPGGAAFLEVVLGSGEAELKAGSPVYRASAIKAPVFLAHGGEDRRAPPQHAERLKDAFDEAGVDYEWFYVRTAGHGFAQPENREKLYTDVLEFLQRNLQAP